MVSGKRWSLDIRIVGLELVLVTQVSRWVDFEVLKVRCGWLGLCATVGFWAGVCFGFYFSLS